MKRLLIILAILYSISALSQPIGGIILTSPCYIPASITGTLSVASGSTTQLTDITAGGVWSSSTTSIATVGTAGLVTGISAGTSTISYVLGNCKATATVTVTSGFAYAHDYYVVSDYTKCGSANSSNITISVQCNVTGLKTVANGGNVTSVTSGIPNDVVFSTDPAYGSFLSWAIEYYDGVNGILKAKVKIPTLSASVNDTIYMAFGNSAITTFQGGSTGSCFDANVKAMYPLSDGTTLSLSDYSSSGLTASNVGTSTATSGQIDGAVNFNGTSQYLTLPSNPLTLTSDFTVSWWVNETSTASNARYVSLIPSTTTNFQLNRDNGTASYAVLLMRSGTSTINQLIYGAITTGSWVNIAYTMSGSTGTFYKNGSVVATTGSTSVGVGSSTGYDIGVRADLNSTTYLGGKMDEVEYDQTARSTSWILSKYNNQNSPGNIGSAGFWTYTLKH